MEEEMSDLKKAAMKIVFMDSAKRWKNRKVVRAQVQATFPPPSESEMRMYNRANEHGGSGCMDAARAYGKRTGIDSCAGVLLQVGWMTTKGALSLKAK